MGVRKAGSSSFRGKRAGLVRGRGNYAGRERMRWCPGGCIGRWPRHRNRAGGWKGEIGWKGGILGVGRSLGTALRRNGVTYSLASVVWGIKGGTAISQVCW